MYVGGLGAFPPGTIDPSSSDVRTVEQTRALGNMSVPGTSMVRAEFRGKALTPQGTVVDGSMAVVPPARAAEFAAILAAGTDTSKPSGGYILVLNTDGVPVEYDGVFPSKDMLAFMIANPKAPGMPDVNWIQTLIDNNPYGLTGNVALVSTATPPAAPAGTTPAQPTQTPPAAAPATPAASSPASAPAAAPSATQVMTAPASAAPVVAAAVAAPNDTSMAAVDFGVVPLHPQDLPVTADPLYKPGATPTAAPVPDDAAAAPTAAASSSMSPSTLITLAALGFVFAVASSKKR